MIITDRFIFIHLHKSGGTFVNDFIRHFFPSSQQIGYHLPGRLVPPEYRHLPSLGFVRNPWSYYVSWYIFQSTMDNPNPLFLIVSDYKTLGFIPTINNLINLSTDHKRLDVIASFLPDNFSNTGFNLTKKCLYEYKDTHIGFYSFLYNRMYGDLDNIIVGKMETLRRDLKNFLATSGVLLSPEMLHSLDNNPRLNRTFHGTNHDYFDESLRKLIERKDTILIKKHDYNF